MLHNRIHTISGYFCHGFAAQRWHTVPRMVPRSWAQTNLLSAFHRQDVALLSNLALSISSASGPQPPSLREGVWRPNKGIIARPGFKTTAPPLVHSLGDCNVCLGSHNTRVCSTTLIAYWVRVQIIKRSRLCLDHRQRAIGSPYFFIRAACGTG